MEWNNKKRTPLITALENNSKLKEMGRLLIDKGADINLKDILYQRIKILSLIKRISNKLRNLNPKNKSPLHIVIDRSLNEIGEILISKGADLNAKDALYQSLILFFL